VLPKVVQRFRDNPRSAGNRFLANAGANKLRPGGLVLNSAGNRTPRRGPKEKAERKKKKRTIIIDAVRNRRKIPSAPTRREGADHPRFFTEAPVVFGWVPVSKNRGTISRAGGVPQRHFVCQAAEQVQEMAPGSQVWGKIGLQAGECGPAQFD